MKKFAVALATIAAIGSLSACGGSEKSEYTVRAHEQIVRALGEDTSGWDLPAVEASIKSICSSSDGALYYLGSTTENDTVIRSGIRLMCPDRLDAYRLAR